MPMMLYFAICIFLCPDIVFSDLPRIPRKGFITSFIVSKLIMMFFRKIALQTLLQLMSLCIQQVKCPSRKELIKLPYFLRESTSYATSILALAAYSTFTAMAQLSNLSFFDTDSSFWVCDNSATGYICKDKSLFTGDLVPSIFEVGSATGILTLTLMGTVTLRLTDDEGVLHSFELTNVNYLPNSPVNLLLLQRLAEWYPDATDHPDWHGTGIQLVFNDHILFWNCNQFKKAFMTALSGLPKCLFYSGYLQLKAFSTTISCFYNDKIC